MRRGVARGGGEGWGTVGGGGGEGWTRDEGVQGDAGFAESCGCAEGEISESSVGRENERRTIVGFGEQDLALLDQEAQHDWRQLQSRTQDEENVAQ